MESMKSVCQNAKTCIYKRMVCIITTLFWKIDSLWRSNPRLWRPCQQPAVLTFCSVVLSVVTASEKLTGRRKGSYWKRTWLLSLRRQKSKQTSFVLLLAHFVGQRHTTTRRLVLPSLRASHGPHFRVTLRVRVCTKCLTLVWCHISLYTIRWRLLLIGGNTMKRHVENNFWKMSGHKMQVTGSSEERGRRGTWGILLFVSMTCANVCLLIPENEDIAPLRNGGILLPAEAALCQLPAACPPSIR
jgi:hypothetical protein